MISMVDREAVHAAVHSYRPEAPITLIDVRIACKLDGHPIDHINKDELGRIVREICSVEDGPRGHHDYRTYRWHR